MNWLKTAAKSEQNGWTDVFGDIQRYGLDAYRCQVYLTKTSLKITVSLTISHDQFGLIVFQEFWRFNLDEGEAARKTFKEVKTVVEGIFTDFETNETPNSMLHTSIREAIRFLDMEHKPTTRIPHVDAARQEIGVTDWRKSIYGNRYPQQDGF